MKVVILCGGLGTRLSEKTETIPKPMVEIGGYPLLWHLMKYYAHWGFNDFILALGYKSEVIKQYFLDYFRRSVDSTVSLATGQVSMHNTPKENWTVRLVDTGLHTQTGGRLQRLSHLLDSNAFMLTYGDGLCNVNLKELIRYHRSHGAIATVTAVRPPARFGGLALDGDHVAQFIEKPQIGDGWINGGFFVLEPAALKYINNSDDCIFEREPLEHLSLDRQLIAYRHEGFWQCMDTLRDVRLLEEIWSSGKAPWEIYK